MASISIVIMLMSEYLTLLRNTLIEACSSGVTCWVAKGSILRLHKPRSNLVRCLNGANESCFSPWFTQLAISSKAFRERTFLCLDATPSTQVIKTIAFFFKNLLTFHVLFKLNFCFRSLFKNGLLFYLFPCKHDDFVINKNEFYFPVVRN